MKKQTIIGALILGGIIGGYFGVRFQMRLYDALVVHNTRINVMDEFLTKTFPDQVGVYLKTKNSGAGVSAPVPLSATATVSQ